MEHDDGSWTGVHEQLIETIFGRLFHVKISTQNIPHHNFGVRGNRVCLRLCDATVRWTKPGCMSDGLALRKAFEISEIRRAPTRFMGVRVIAHRVTFCAQLLHHIRKTLDVFADTEEGRRNLKTPQYFHRLACDHRVWAVVEG